MQLTWTVAELDLISMDAILQILPPPKSKFFSFSTPLFHNNYLFKNLNVINNENRIKIKENNNYFFLDIYLDVRKGSGIYVKGKSPS